MKIRPASIGSVHAAAGLALLLACLGTPGARAEGSAPEDLSPCPGSAPEPGQSAPWPVAFCNRTGHDIVVEFHDNECPAREWSRRGDVYQRTLRRGESKTLPLCYANESPGKKPAPGEPIVRIPGGKGVTTTWTVVGDCGDRSKPLNVDARTFYDRGEYKTGIILLQYPAGASHCTSDASIGASPTNAATTYAGASGAPSSAGANAPAAGASAAAAAAPTTPTAPAVPRSSGAPTLSAVIDPKSITKNAVLVFAKGGAGYRCNFNLALTFSDGGTWNDHEKVDIAGSEDLPIVTRKYLKSVSQAQISANSCAPK